MLKKFLTAFLLNVIAPYAVFIVCAEEPFLELQYHPIGEGNCVTAKMYSSQGKEYNMLFDCGTRSYFREHLYRKYFEKLPEDTTIEDSEKNLSDKNSTSSSSSKCKSEPKSTMKQSSKRIHSDISDQIKSKTEKQEMKAQNEIIKNIKKALQSSSNQHNDNEDVFASSSNSSTSIQSEAILHVNLVVISHPDKDHYDWLPKVFDKDFKIDTIILGGLPENYNKKLFELLTKAKNNGTKIYFPAISFQAIDDLNSPDIKLSGISRDEWSEKEDKNLKPHVFSHHENGNLMLAPNISIKDNTSFMDDLKFDDHFKLFFLSVNPSHISGFEDKILRLSPSDEKNNDSLVVKLKFYDQSVTLTGDATGLVTKRIRNNYFKSSDFLKSTIVDGAHHGSATEDTNDKLWVQALSPSYVIFNNGVSSGHPSQKTYENFRNQENTLKIVELHDVWVGKASGLEYLENITSYSTHRAIFSTLNNGRLIFKLEPKKEIQVTSILGEKSISYVPLTNIKSSELDDRTVSLNQKSNFKGIAKKIDDQVKKLEKEKEEKKEEKKKREGKKDKEEAFKKKKTLSSSSSLSYKIPD